MRGRAASPDPGIFRVSSPSPGLQDLFLLSYENGTIDNNEFSALHEEIVPKNPYFWGSPRGLWGTREQEKFGNGNTGTNQNNRREQGNIKWVREQGNKHKKITRPYVFCIVEADFLLNAIYS